ncbi:MAG TPA: HD domain-containing phosphohydrolase [Acidobacteriaceae bacterium]|nr:HD domain-containing phosphohydrolase [Acidobacteriaceae bacterium]
MPIRAKAFISVTATAGAIVLFAAFLHWHSNDLLKFFCYLIIAVLASTMKVRLPGMESTMSVHFLFVLLGVLDLSLAETLAIGCAAALVQSLWKTKQKPEAAKVIFNVFSMTATAIWMTYSVYHLSEKHLANSTPLLLMVAAFTYFLTNTVPVAIVIALHERIPLRKIWGETYFWSLPYYLVGAAVAGLVSFSNRYIGWENALLIVPIMYWIFRSYQLYLGRLEEEKKRAEIEARQVDVEKLHVEEVCALHLRTIEGLALAIDAKDHTTHEHLHRVRTYAVEIARDLNLGDEDMDALRAAALLHDIGKLAVPDHIINKPGRLTPEEFEKMKIHPVVGAEILEKVAFPYPVAPIVRAHHEKWNGKGYPDGLKGEEIPIGARILAAVDCLDALASDRQYRKALPLDEAMEKISEESGSSFDPAIVKILERRYMELENLAVRTLDSARRDSLSFDRSVERGENPAAGFEADHSYKRGSHADFLSSIASARQEAHTLFELSQDLGNTLSLDENLSLVAMRLRKLVPYDSIVAFIKKGDQLTPEFVSGDNFRLLSSMVIPIGTGLCGWVAQNARSIINGNPAVEKGFVHDPKNETEPRSALVVPLEGVTGLVGVLALYQAEPDAFTSDHLRVLQVITSRVALFIENALKYREAESSATIDYLTGMANARALSMHLEQELARCKRESGSIAVMVCDLNGFKQINDRYGHLAGDKVLKIFGNLLREACRQDDYTARMGGDEFVIIAPGMPPNLVSERAALLTKLAQRAGSEVCGRDFLSLSMGAAFYPQDGTETEQLLAEADRKMYAAKQHFYKDSEALPMSIPKRTAHPAIVN